MKTMKVGLGIAILSLFGLASVGCQEHPINAEGTDGAGRLVALESVSKTFSVSGNAVHYFSTAIVHSQEPAGNGMTQQSTDIIKLSGDLNGYILYHPTSVFDYGAGTLVNTGTQVFSGTVAGSAPVLLHDNTFRFEVDLNTGATTGEVHLGRSKEAPNRGGWYECNLVVVGTGMTPEGDNLSDYSGECTQRGNPKG